MQIIPEATCHLFWRLLFVALIGLSTSAAGTERHALVIGNSDYAESPLVNPVNDATDMASALDQLGYQVYEGKAHLNVDQESMESLINEFSDNLPRKSVALFYFAGHGANDDNRTNYLIPINASIKREQQIKHKAISIEYVVDTLKDSNRRGLNILLVDACRDRPFGRSFSRSGSRGLSRPSSNIPRGVFIGLSADEGQVALDGEGRNGVYTRYLLRALREQPNRPIENVHKTVSESVYQATSEKRVPQLPVYRSKFFGEYCFGECGQSLATSPQPGRQPLINSVAYIEPEMVFLSGGTYTMGSEVVDAGRHYDENLHQVTVNDFYLSAHETTFKEFDAFARETNRLLPNDNGWGREDRPVINISWQDATAYAAWLSQKTGRTYRLPTEAEWEFAARGASFAATANCSGCGVTSSTSKTQPVGRFAANSHGLHDMRGNVWELTCSLYNADYSGAETSCADEGSQKWRSIRGGSWQFSAMDARPANRSYYWPDSANSNLGFRLARDR